MLTGFLRRFLLTCLAVLIAPAILLPTAGNSGLSAGLSGGIAWAQTQVQPSAPATTNQSEEPAEEPAEAAPPAQPATPAPAQPQPQTPPASATPSGPIADATQKVAEAGRELDALQARFDANMDADLVLVELKGAVDSNVRNLLDISVSLRPRLNEIKGRLTELGEAPKEGDPAEAPEITDERSRLNAERMQINALTGQAEDLSIRGTTLSNLITDTRRQLFTNRLFEHTEVSPTVVTEAVSTFAAELGRFERTVTSWLTFVWKFKPISLGLAVALSLSLALLLLTVEYRLFGALIRRDRTLENPEYISRISVAFWSTIQPAMVIGAFLFATYFLLDTFNVLRDDIAPIAKAFFGFLGLLAFVLLLARAALAPKDPKWRLVKLSNKGARDLNIAVFLMVFINGFDYVIGAVSVTLSSPLVLTVMKSFVSSVCVGLIIFLVSFLHPVLDDSRDPTVRGKPWPKALAVSFRVIGALLIFASAIGYVGLARFLATQIIVTGAVLATMYIGILSGKAISAPDRFAETRAGRLLGRRFSLTPVALDQAGMVAGLLIYIFSVMVGLPLIFLSWGFQPQDLQSWIYQAFTEISLGSIRISLVGIFSGVLLFIFGLLATRWFQKWLDGSVMARSHVDGGVRNSVKTGVGYLGTAIAGLIGISAAGIDLSSLALVAGALSLGIGFGLQNIVSNFVSGLILLAERPFKVGDWVVTGTTEGHVRRISVRATEIETFQRQSIIVPNSELINAAVGNWTHRNRLARVDIPIGVGYENDARKVIALLQDIAKEQEGVLLTPEPFVVFVGFGMTALDFQLSFFVPDIMDSLAVKNGVRIVILERFREEGIHIPYQIHDVNLFLQRGHLEMQRTAPVGLEAEPDEEGRLPDGDEPDTVPPR